MKYIPAETKEKIHEAAKQFFPEVLQSFVDLRRDGQANMKGECHSCYAAGHSLKFSKAKGVAKCFKCDTAAGDAINYLIRFEGYEYLKALHYIADRYGITIEEEKRAKPKKDKNSQLTFRNSQLIRSGIPDKEQKWHDRINQTTEAIRDRFERGSIDQFGKVNPSGDDMLLNYIDLDGKPILFKDKRGKERPLIRVRYQFPEHHLDKDGNPVKYRSPAGSGSHFWIPMQTILNFKQKKPYTTLYIVEGEKKATKLSLHGALTLGIMGIHNFAYAGEMPHQLLAIIKACNVKNVVFLLDQDLYDISIKSGKSVDQRPKTFFAAVRKFRDYIKGFEPEIQLKAFFGHHISEKSKGIDDFLVNELKDDEQKFIDEVEKAITDRTHTTDLVQLHYVSPMSDYQLKEFWHLQSHAAFIKAHQEQLVKLGEFKLGRLKRRVNEDGQIELAQKILPHEEYWKEEIVGKKVRFSFSYLKALNFLKARGYGLYRITADLFRYIHIEDNVVREVTPHNIQHFVKNFTSELDVDQKDEIQEMLLRGMTQYFGPDKLSQMDYLYPELFKVEKGVQYLFFKTKYVKITKDNIEIQPLNNLPNKIWEDNIIDFDPKLIPDFFEVERKKDHWQIDNFGKKHKGKPPWEKSELAQFLYHTSLTFWRKIQKIKENPDGTKKWVDDNTANQPTVQEIKETFDHLVSKLISIGYVIYGYRDKANRKAIVAMDMAESEVGISQGGTGKSIFSTMFEHILPIFVIDGKSPKLAEDQFLYDGVDERTKAIVFDDCRVNFPFEFLFSQISRGITVNQKGKKKFTIDPVPFILNTNHAFNGEGNSFKRRQFLIAFSDYYNEYRTPADEFGHQLFYDWDNEQWNYFYNIIFKSVQLFLRYGLKYQIPVRNIEKRKLRQRMGENFLEWATAQWGESSHWINNQVEKRYAYDTYIRDYPNDRKYTNVRTFKRKVKMYAKYSGLHFNPDRAGEAIKSGNKEYLCLANNQYKPAKSEKIDSMSEWNPSY